MKPRDGKAERVVSRMADVLVYKYIEQVELNGIDTNTIVASREWHGSDQHPTTGSESGSTCGFWGRDGLGKSRNGVKQERNARTRRQTGPWEGGPINISGQVRFTGQQARTNAPRSRC